MVDTFVEMFEMEIVEKKGTSCRRLCYHHPVFSTYTATHRHVIRMSLNKTRTHTHTRPLKHD